jgi:hypothetical protein
MPPDGLVPASHLRAAAASQPAPGADGASGMGPKHKRGQTMREGASMPPTRCAAATATAAVLRSILVKRSNPVMFTRPSTRYGVTPEAVTPYQRAAQIWDDRIGSARVQARNWRLACFGSLGLAGLLATGLIWQSAHGSIVPWVVEVDRLAKRAPSARPRAAIRPVIRRSRSTSPASSKMCGRFQAIPSCCAGLAARL